MTKNIFSKRAGEPISSNLRAPDHLGMDFGSGKTIFFSDRNRICRAFFDVFQAQEHSWNDPGQVCEKYVLPMFADFRRTCL